MPKPYTQYNDVLVGEFEGNKYFLHGNTMIKEGGASPTGGHIVNQYGDNNEFVKAHTTTIYGMGDSPTNSVTHVQIGGENTVTHLNTARPTDFDF